MKRGGSLGKRDSSAVVTVSANSFSVIRSHTLKMKCPAGFRTRRASWKPRPAAMSCTIRFSSRVDLQAAIGTSQFTLGAADVIRILQDDLGLLLRGELVERIHGPFAGALAGGQEFRGRKRLRCR